MPLLRQESRLFIYILLGLLLDNEFICPSLDIFFAILVVPPPPVSLRRVDHLVSGVLVAVVVGIAYG